MPWLLVVTPSPSPSLNVAPDAVTPGIVGFVAIFVIAAAAVLLALDMVRRIRRVRYRGEFAARREAADRDRAERREP